MQKKESKWYIDIFKINIWVIVLMAGWFWTTFLQPAIAKDFATVKYTDKKICELDEKLEAVSSNLEESINKLTHKIDKQVDKIDDIYKILIRSGSR